MESAETSASTGSRSMEIGLLVQPPEGWGSEQVLNKLMEALAWMQGQGIQTEAVELRPPAVAGADSNDTATMEAWSSPFVNLSPPFVNLSPPFVNLSPPTLRLSPPTIRLSSPTINLSSPRLGG